MFFSPITKPIKTYSNIGFDIETFGNDNKFLMSSLFVDDKNIKTFYEKEDFFKYILDNYKFFDKKRIFAHNLQFDFIGTFYDSEHFKNFQICQRGTDFISAKSYIYGKKFNFFSEKNRNNFSVSFFDTMNFYKNSLENIGKIINMPKMKKPDFIGQYPKNNDEWDYITKYNINDSKVTKYFADFLQNSFNYLGAEMKGTIASTSMNLFKRKYLKQSFYTPKIKDIEEMYKCYYGGRTEILNRGFTTEKINVYDFNSLYPAVMENNLFPHPNYMRKSHKIIKDSVLNYEGFCYSELEFNDKIKIPYLPVRTDTKLLFPKGKIKGYYTFFELRNAIEYGYKIKKFGSGFYYTKSINLFSDFVKDLYAQRMKYKNENSPMEMPIKIISNSLYGKFAQKLEHSELKHFDNLKYSEYADGEQIGNTDFYRIKTKEKQERITFINPIISAYVTSYARDKLYRKIKDIEDNVFYMDTDSIFTTKNLNNSTELGDLKHEYTSKESYLVKPKFYYCIDTNDKEKIKIKGISDIKSFNDFKSIIDNKKAQYSKFLKLKESLIQQKIPNSKFLSIKDLNLEDNKRDWRGKLFSINDFSDSVPLSI